jgi:hypothetical protein
MCFSANVSFMVGIPLIASGVYGSVIAKRHDKRYLLLALCPLFFGIQQLTEGQVWLSLNAGYEASMLLFAHVYLFFAFFLWPVVVPLSLCLIEHDPYRKRIMRWMAVAGGVLGLLLYVPILSKMVPVTVASVQHSICYQTYQSVFLLYPFSILYALITIIPMLMSSLRLINIMGVISIVAFSASYWSLIHAFTSIWCFAQAIVSLGIVYLMYQVKQKAQLGFIVKP